jgi:hypothetical protein
MEFFRAQLISTLATPVKRTLSLLCHNQQKLVNLLNSLTYKDNK